jgi:hypothetical protein
MKPFTQEFDICIAATQANLYKINRTLNTTDDALARQAFSVAVFRSADLGGADFA